MPPTGEQIQQLGEQGAQRAKRWLESTCRAEVKWNNPAVGVGKLQYRKAGAGDQSEAQGDWFSFDLGGTLLGGDQDGNVFLAEAKKYQNAADQGVKYRTFLAQCYCVEQSHSQFVDQYLWITWAPFLVNTWETLLTPAFVKTAATEDTARKYIALGDADYDAEIGTSVATKVMLVVLGDRQEISLSLRGNELVHVRKALLELRAS